MALVGVDLGGTNVFTVVLGDDGATLGDAKLKTPVTGDRGHVVDVLETSVRAALDDAGVELVDVDAIGVGSPGVVIDGTVGNASNVPGWFERFSLADLLEPRFDRPVRVVNDVTAAAVGEHRFGAGRGYDTLLAVFVGTGVGGGLILDGRPFEGTHGGAGEFGHMVVVLDGDVCPCGRRGCIEAYASRRAMELGAERAVATGETTILFDVMEQQGKTRPTSGVFRDALEAGDRLVADLLERGIEALGAGVASAVNLLDVEAVVLGGGLADKLGEWYRVRLDAAMRPLLFLQPSGVELVAAALGSEGGARGAAALAAELV